MKTESHPLAAFTASLLLVSALNAVAVTVTNTVPGQSNPWLAGMPEGSTASCGDAAFGQSPVPIAGLPITPGDFLNFSVTGDVSLGEGYPLISADGDPGISIRNPAHDVGAENGMPDCRAPYDSLLGVFLGPDQPDLSSAPSALDFSASASRNYITLKPALKQIFFIGDGLDTNGIGQNIVVPVGATRLFLGTMDGCGWNNNTGAFSVIVTETPPPPYLQIKLYPGLTIYGTVGRTSQVEYVSVYGATNWTPLTNFVLPSSPYLFIDADVPLSEQRFYRSVEWP